MQRVSSRLVGHSPRTTRSHSALRPRKIVAIDLGALYSPFATHIWALVSHPASVLNYSLSLWVGTPRNSTEYRTKVDYALAMLLLRDA